MDLWGRLLPVDLMRYGLRVALGFWQEVLDDHLLEVLDLGRAKEIWMVDCEKIEYLQMTWLEGRSLRNRMGSNHLPHHHRRNRRLRHHPNRCYLHEFV